MTIHSWKPYEFIKLTTGWQRNIRHPRSGTRTSCRPSGGVPGEEPHHLPDLRDLGLALVVNLCSDPQFRNAPRKIFLRASGRGAGRPDLLHEVLLEPIMRPLAVIGRVACVLCAGLIPCSYLSCSHQFTWISRSSRSNAFVELPFIIVNGVLIETSIAHSLINGTSGVKSEFYPGLEASCWLIFAGMCTFVFVYCSLQAFTFTSDSVGVLVGREGRRPS
jgi:hypothetical protein